MERDSFREDVVSYNRLDVERYDCATIKLRKLYRCVTIQMCNYTDVSL